MAKTEDEKRLLELLESHGQKFLQSFGIRETEAKKRNREVVTEDEPLSTGYSEEDEWSGIEDSEIESSNEVLLFRSAPSVDTVIFKESSARDPGKITSRAHMRTFMSSKVSKLLQGSQDSQDSGSTEPEEADRTNTENDAILHRLIHTQLLSGSLSSDLDMTPAQRRKAMEGRILELSGKAKLGKGEKSVRARERNRASKRVREGLLDRVDERRKQELAKAKELGNYHPMFKKMYEDDSDKPARKRERGLKMGVGKFSGGMLKLSHHDLEKAHSRGVDRRS